MSGVSIIIPYHQHNNYIKDCLDSIVALDNDNVEVIIVLDHVKIEEIEQVLTMYENTLNLICIEMDTDTGVGAARNMGIEKASNEYLYFLDSDDYLIDQGLNQMITVAEQKHAAIVSGIKVDTWYKRYTFMKDYFQNDKSNTIKQDDLDKDTNTKDLLNQLFKSEDISALNTLIKKSFVCKHGIQFMKKNQYYSDLPFVMKLAVSIESEYDWFICDCHSYAKRIHNDSIQFPALSQIIDPKRMKDFLEAFLEAKCLIRENQGNTQNSSEQSLSSYYDMLNDELDTFCCRFLLKAYLKQYHSGKDTVLDESECTSYSQVLKDMKNSVLLQFDKNEYKILLAVKENRRTKAVAKANKVIIKQKRKGLFGNTIQRARALDKIIFRRLPVKKNYIMFESFGGKSYSDSPKYIYEYMLKQYGKEYKYIWVMRQHVNDIPGKPTVIKPNTYRYLYYLARSRALIFNSRQPIWYNKRKESTFIQTWHGTPLKKLVFDMEDVHSASRTHKEDFYKVSRKWDYLISDNAFSTDVFEHAFLYDRDKILEYGYPRNDLLYAQDVDSISKQVKKELNIPNDKKVLLYAPTWRDDEYYESGQYKFTLAIDLAQMKEQLGDKYVIVLRTHYFVVDQVDQLCDNEFVFNGSRYQDITKLYLIADICITDYSSVFFDYANLKRPILFFTYDLEKYREELHGFYIDMETEVPGPLLQTNNELIHAIQNIDKIQMEYKERYQQFYDRFCNIDDGNASKRVVENIIRCK